MHPALATPEGPDPADDRLAREILDRLSQTVFACGLGAAVVERHWPATRRAFAGFDLDVVAAMDVATLEELAADRRLIRNPRKLRAVVDNAGRLRAAIAPHGSAAAWLESLRGDEEASVSRLISTFRYVGRGGAPRLLGRLRELAGD